MKIFVLIAVIGCVSRCLDAKDLNPPIFPEEDDKINGQVAEHLNNYKALPVKDESLPLLLKTLRLRPGSDAYNKIVDEFINGRQQGRDKRDIGSGKEKIPPFRHEEDDKTKDMFEEKREKRDVNVDHNPDQSLPLLMKTLRLRPGSDAYQKVVDDFLRSRADGNHDHDREDEDPRLLGEPLIGSNRHPAGGNKPIKLDESKSGETELPLLLKTLQLRPGSPEYERVINDFLKNHGAADEPGRLGENMIGRHRRPKHDKENHNDVSDNRPPEWKAGDKLIEKKRKENSESSIPLLLKTLRLRPGSVEYQRIIDEFLSSRIKASEKRSSNPEDDDPRLLGEPMIGSNRHPPAEDKPNSGIGH